MVTEIPFRVIGRERPNGVHCATCHRHIAFGQPYLLHPWSFDGQQTQSDLTCVYCPPPDKSRRLVRNTRPKTTEDM